MDISKMRVNIMVVGKVAKRGRDLYTIKKTKVVQGNHLNKQNGDMQDIHFIHCSFIQEDPFTKLKFKNCVFEGCNLVNCELDVSNQIIDCNTSQRKLIKEAVSKEMTIIAYDRHTKKIRKTSKYVLEDGQ